MHSALCLRSEDLHRARNQAAALERARWLDELAEAISQAQRLTWSLGVQDGDSVEARALYARLEAARSEVQALRYGDWVDVRAEVDPLWLGTLLNQHIPMAK
jgi:hypothetical protein